MIGGTVMWKSKNQENKKISYFKLFFTRYTIWGVVIILVSIIIDLCNSDNIFLLNILKNGLSTFGCALLVGAILDFSKNSEAFTIFVSNILRNIGISK